MVLANAVANAVASVDMAVATATAGVADARAANDVPGRTHDALLAARATEAAIAVAAADVHAVALSMAAIPDTDRLVAAAYAAGYRAAQIDALPKVVPARRGPAHDKETTMTTKRKLTTMTAVQVARLGEAALYRGYVYRCEPDTEDVRHGSPGDDKAPGWDFGFHGTDVPPCAAEYLCDADDDAYLVISTCDQAEGIETVDGWTLTPADLDAGTMAAGTVFDDGTWALVVVKAHGRHEYTVAGTL